MMLFYKTLLSKKNVLNVDKYYCIGHISFNIHKFLRICKQISIREEIL